MRALRLISTTAAILLLGACAVAAQEVKTDETPGVPAAQQNAPPEKMAPAKNSDRMKAPEGTGATAPTAPETANKQRTMDKQQTMDKEAPAGAAAKMPRDAVGGLDVKSQRTGRHVGARYASRHHGPLYNSYTGTGYRHCHHHSWMPWLWC
jgi:hypothetical protein